MESPQSPLDTPADAQQNLPGAVPEVPIPVAKPSVDTARELPARGDASVPVYSPRSSFVPPDVEAAKFHATENRPMMRDEKSGQILPYAPQRAFNDPLLIAA
jgi:hypothetical protein